MDSDQSLKTRILAEAEERFLREGFSRVRVDDIARELGISKKTFYKHFGSKEDLLRQIVRRTMSDTHASILKILESDKRFVAKLDDLMAFLGNQYARIGKNLMTDCHRYVPDLWDTVQKFRRERITSNVRGLILEGVREGLIREDLSVEVFQTAFIAGVEAVITPLFLADHPMDGRQALRSIMMMFFQGILTDPAREQLTVINHPAHL